MITGKYGEAAQMAKATSADTLTKEDIWRLTMFQQRCGYQPHLLELDMDICRLEYARWLVQHGILNEGLKTAFTDSLNGENYDTVTLS